MNRKMTQTRQSVFKSPIESRSMRRWLTVLLFVFMPLQAIWAAAAPYCGHEESPAAMHVGHHEHEHQDSPTDLDEVPVALGDHTDCHVCHGAGAVVPETLGVLTQVVPQGPAPTSAKSLPTPPVSFPERPNWARLA